MWVWGTISLGRWRNWRSYVEDKSEQSVEIKVEIKVKIKVKMKVKMKASRIVGDQLPPNPNLDQTRRIRLLTSRR